MKDYIRSYINFFITIFKIAFVLSIISVIGYFILINYIDKRMQSVEEQNRIIREESEKTSAELEKQNKKAGAANEDKEKANAYATCMNKAYAVYKTKYDEECSKFIIDGQCQVMQEKLYEIQGYYMFDKKQCEKLKE